MKISTSGMKGFPAGAVITAAIVTTGLAPAAGFAQSSSSLGTELVADGLSRPLFVTALPDDDRLFILEQGGLVKIIKDGNVLATPFLDISAKTTGFGERGLLGLAFHPDYVDNGYFYINYTNLSGDTVVARYSVSADDPDVADPDSEYILLMIDQPYSNHNGGMIAFGPSDGYLYIGTGDGGSANDPGNRAQTITDQWLGKLLRIDVDGDDFPDDPDRNYAIPPSNPFVDVIGDDEIWAYGLRNPWRWSFDRGTADLWIGDVGQGVREEIDVQPADSPGGENYGWRCMEGFRCTGLSGCTCDAPELTLPIYDYPHSPHCSITGGYVYRGDAIPLLQGTYFFADYCSAYVWTLRYDGNSVIDFQDRTAELAPGGALDIGSITSFGEDSEGNLYIVDQNDGEIYRVVTDLRLESTDLNAGDRAYFRTTGADPGTQVYFAYSLKGTGETVVPPLNVRLAIQNPKLIGHAKANGNGTAVLNRSIPSNAVGLTVWLQSAVSGNTSNVVRKVVQ